MPLLKPEIQEALRSVGLSRESGNDSVSDILNDNNLSLRDSIELLSDIAHSGGEPGERRRAIETAFKLHGVLKDTPSVIPQVTIIISDPEAVAGGVNPILIPRPQRVQ